MSAERPHHAARHTSRAVEPRDPHGQPDLLFGAAARGDNGIGAERDRQVRDDTKRVVHVDAVEDVFGCVSRSHLLHSPRVERGAMGAAGGDQSPQVGRAPAGERRRAGAQGRENRRQQRVPLIDARTRRAPTLGFERLLDEADHLLQLGHQLDERAVAARRTGRPGRAPAVLGADGMHGRPRGVAAPFQLVGLRTAHGFDQFSHRQTSPGRPAAQKSPARTMARRTRRQGWRRRRLAPSRPCARGWRTRPPGW